MIPCCGAQGHSQFDAVRPQIERDDDRPLQPRQLPDQLSHQPLTDHRDHITQAEIGDTHRIHGDAAQSGKASVFTGDACGYLCNQVAARNNSLGMPGTFAAICHDIASREIGDSSVFLHHRACSGNIPVRRTQ